MVISVVYNTFQNLNLDVRTRIHFPAKRLKNLIVYPLACTHNPWCPKKVFLTC